ncbi:MAG TPA: hypothetical protein VGV06_06630 [Methylomirabilota bacterium]|nr:hypothetical protein [Methylomirabilota bacterium]
MRNLVIWNVVVAAPILPKSRVERAVEGFEARRDLTRALFTS